MLLLATSLFFAATFDAFDAFETLAGFLYEFEILELDELFIGFVLLLFGVIVDLIRFYHRRHVEHRMEEEKRRVLRSTMFTVLDIVNSLVASVKLYQYESEHRAGVHSAPVTKLDKDMARALHRLKAIQKMEVVHSVSLGDDLFVLREDRIDQQADSPRRKNVRS